jgi:TonB-dependent starch-binding outer membrane protein SusC
LSEIVEVRPGETVSRDFRLSVSPVALDEFVVTATGMQRRRELGNAAVTIQAEQEMARVAPANFSELLQGRAAGVTVLRNSGTLGAASTVKVRGNSSISMDNTPLVYVDGARISNDVLGGPDVHGQTTSRLDDLTVEDIESIEIVKGPSAATLYGTEAAAGVIRITTKRGRPGTAEWTLRSGVGANWDDTDWPASVWNPRAFFGEAFDVANFFPPGVFPPGTLISVIPDTLYTMSLLGGRTGATDFGTPWRTGLEQTHGVSLRGGGRPGGVLPVQ